jgi:hypothetical protein
MGRWFYTVAGQQRGPVELQNMQSLVASGQILPDTFVWEEGMPQWIPAQQAPQLFQASAPPLIPISAPPAPMQMTDDAGPFVRMGNTFSRTGAGRYIGNVVASPNAFYILKLRRNNSNSYHVGGLVGMLVATAFQSEDDSRSCSLGELPMAVRSELDPKSKYAEKDVIVLPRGAVSLVKASSWTGIKVECGPDTFNLTPRAFKGKSTREFLTSNGWKLNEPMMPTMAAIHGSNFNRPAGFVPSKKKGVMARLALILLAIVIAIILIAVIVGLQH